MAFNPLDPEWPKQTADLVDKVVQGVKSKFTTKAVTVTNAIVYGFIVMFAALVSAVVGLVIAVRSLQAYLTWDTDRWPLWIVGGVALLGLLMVLIGVIKSSKGVVAVGAVLLLGAGARWALDVGD